MMGVFSFLNPSRRKMAGMVNHSSRKVNRKKSFVVRLWKSKPLCRVVVLLLILTASVYSLISKDRMPVIPHLVKDQTAAYTVYAAFDFSYEDRKRTDKARASALAQLPLFYKVSDTAAANVMTSITDFFKEIGNRKQAAARNLPYLPPNTEPGRLAQSLSPEEFQSILIVAGLPQTIHKITQLAANVVDNGMVPSYDKENIPWTKLVRIIDTYNRIRESKQLKNIPTVAEAAVHITRDALETYSAANKKDVARSLVTVLRQLLPQGQMKSDRAETEKREKEISASIQPVMAEILKGQPIITKDKVVTEEDILILDAYAKAARERVEELNTTSLVMRILKSTALCLLILLFSGIYMYHIHKDVLQSNTIIRMLAFITIAAILFNMLASHVFMMFGELESIPPWLSYLALPLAFAPMVLSSVYGMRCALFTGLFVTVIAALTANDSFNVVLTGLMISGISAFAVRRSVNYRNFFISGFLAVSLTTLLVGLLLVWRDMNAGRGIYPWVFILPFANGLVTTMMTQIMLYVLEVAFDATTNMSLLLYSDYNHPLLKRLQFEAPGTYHHSLVVSTLAEAAAQEIGANPIKARVCALFHDVGKLSHPEYFTENSGGEDKHRELTPKISALIILNHVKEGLELARKYKLKKLMRDAIQQHHGTDLVYFFYKRAKDSGECIDEHDFRYQGPNPQSKEIAILSLADACEAASRSLQKPSHGKIDELVSEIIQKRLRDGQLDSANLTFKELSIIRNSFVKTLTSMLHARVAYPKEVVQDEDDLFVDAAARKAAEAKNS